jgi:hypothetical protein
VRAARSSGAELVGRARRLMERPTRQGPALPETTWAAALCEAEHSRLIGRSIPDRWETAAAASDSLHHPYRAAYARMRQAEALLGEGATDEATALLRHAEEAAARLGAEPLRQLIRSLAARHDLDQWQPAAEAEART